MPEYPQENLPKQHRKRESKIIIMDDPSYQIRPLQQMFSALGGAIATAFTVTPVEVVKTRIQLPPRRCYMHCKGLRSHLYEVEEEELEPVRRQFKLRAIREAFKSVREAQGFKGFYSGLAPTLLSALPSTVLYFVAYEQFKKRFIMLKYNENLSYFPDMTFFVPIMASISARILSASICTPFELVRIKMQADAMSYAQTYKAVQNIIKSRGVKGLWNGLVPILLRDAPFSAIYWTTYETLKAYFCEGLPTFKFSFLAGAASGALAASLTTPLDVVTTRTQVEAGEQLVTTGDNGNTKIISPKTVRNQLRKIYRLEGIKGLYAGLIMRLIKVMPSCAIMLSVFEYGNRYFYNRNKKKSENK